MLLNHNVCKLVLFRWFRSYRVLSAMADIGLL